MNAQPVAPLFLDFSEDGLAELDAAIAYLRADFGMDYAERFTTVTGRVLADTCRRVAEEIAGDGRAFDAPNETASLRFSCPVYRERVELSKHRARRNSTGLWYVYYRLEDRNRANRADTLVVVAVRHSASHPFMIESANSDA